MTSRIVLATAAVALVLVAVGGAVSYLGSPARDEAWTEVPTPTLSGRPVTLRVVYAVNPRLPQFTREQLDRLLDTASSTAEAHFGVRVGFELTGTMPIDALFDAMPPAAWRKFRAQIHDPGEGASAYKRLHRATYEALRSQGVSAEVARSYLAPDGDPPTSDADLRSLTTALLARQLAAMARWRTVRAADGRPVVTETPYHQWLAWSALGYRELPYDVVLTNQLVSSAEYVGAELHAMVRGGVAIGTTFYSSVSAYDAYVMFSTFMFSDALPEVVALRGDGVYAESEAATLAGAYLAHELGHLLLRLGHPYGNAACVMRPAVAFRFRAWFASLDPGRCRVGGEPQMRPGAVRLGYYAALVR